MKKYKNIILDYGNVIFDIEHQRTIKAFEALGISSASEIFGHLEQASIFNDFEKGQIEAHTFRNFIRENSSATLTDTKIDHAWNALLIGVPKHYWNILLTLRKDYRVFLLSNNNEIHYDWIMDYLQKEHNMINMDAYFEQQYYSHLMDMRKPDANIFEFVLNDHNLNPAETIFVDDTPHHLATAIKLGIHTYWVEKGVKTLEDFVTEAL